MTDTSSLVVSAAGGQVLLNATGVPWVDGATHPIDEVNQLVALLVVGIAAALLGGRSRWGLPLMFIMLLGFGIILGGQGAVAPMLDTIVMTTALAFVLLILGKVRLVFAIVASVIGAFALFHGVADGYLMRVMKPGPQFVIGYTAITVALLGVGLMIGEWLHRHIASWSEHWHHFTDHLHGLRPGG